jgi:hypothetical protein
MDDSFDDWVGDRSFNVPEEIDLMHLKTDNPLSIGDHRGSTRCTNSSNNPMDVSALKVSFNHISLEDDLLHSYSTAE